MHDDGGRQNGWYAVGGAFTLAGSGLFSAGLTATPRSQTLEFLGLIAFVAGLAIIIRAMIGPRSQGVIVAVSLLAIGGGSFAIFGQGHPASQPATTSASQTPGPAPTVGSSATSALPRTVLYLDSISPSSGGPISRGMAHINGVSFDNSIWLQFALNCCGSEQSVTFSIPAGYKQFDGVLGQESAGFTSANAYVMFFSISVNSSTAINNQQVMFTDPADVFNIPLSGAPTSILIDVTTTCSAFTCSGNAVIGDARLLPSH
jgi:hypothetical protein